MIRIDADVGGNGERLVRDVLCLHIGVRDHRARGGKRVEAAAADGGDVEIIDIKENLIYVDLTGACATCPGASGTIQHVIEKKLRDKVDDALRVIQI